ncbi:MAG: hypothetical protein ACQEP1_03135 [Nanobdellota archaeon]
MGKDITIMTEKNFSDAARTKNITPAIRNLAKNYNVSFPESFKFYKETKESYSEFLEPEDASIVALQSLEDRIIKETTGVEQNSIETRTTEGEGINIKRHINDPDNGDIIEENDTYIKGPKGIKQLLDFYESLSDKTSPEELADYTAWSYNVFRFDNPEGTKARFMDYLTKKLDNYISWKEQGKKTDLDLSREINEEIDQRSRHIRTISRNEETAALELKSRGYRNLSRENFFNMILDEYNDRKETDKGTKDNNAALYILQNTDVIVNRRQRPNENIYKNKDF